MDIQTKLHTADHSVAISKHTRRTARRWLFPLAVVAMAALAVVGLDQLHSDKSPAKGPATVHAAGASEPMIGPEEQAFINRVRLARIASVGGRVPIVSSPSEPLIDQVEQAFIDQMRHLRLAAAGGVSARFAPLVGPDEKAFIDRCALVQIRCGLV